MGGRNFNYEIPSSYKEEEISGLKNGAPLRSIKLLVRKSLLLRGA